MASNLVRLADIREAASSGQARRLRLAAGLSLGEIARELGVSVPTVLRWETGGRRPRGGAALRYGELLEELIERSDDS
jgi:transcriptional regulator with XRE-family HTH domain